MTETYERAAIRGQPFFANGGSRMIHRPTVLQPKPVVHAATAAVSQPDAKAEAASIKASWRAAAKASFIETVPEAKSLDQPTGSNAGWQSAIAKMNRQQGM